MHWLEQHWYRVSPLHLLLWPLSLLFAMMAAARRLCYRCGLLPATRLPVPVVVVGNISVGGTGKTPLVIWLVDWLQQHGHRPGVVCRGYGGSSRTPQRVTADSDPKVAGDEAVLLAQRCTCPVWIGRRRVQAARALLAATGDCDVIVSDDGLQHLALARDVAIAVIDGERGFGNGMLLPAGPLREPPRLLVHADAVVTNGDAWFPREILPSEVPSFDMKLKGEVLYALNDPRHQVGPAYFNGQQVHAVAAIGNPQRFFHYLRELGISCSAHAFPDHHEYQASDLAFGDEAAVIMTEKDAVKCARFVENRFWVLRVDATVDLTLGELVLRKLEGTWTQNCSTS